MADSLHFAYASKNEFKADELCQGDVLERTRKLKQLLEQLYPHVVRNKENYPYFVVLTQSCDLERRGKPCNAEHITLAAVRSIQYLLSFEVSRLQKYPALQEVGICLREKKGQVLQRVQKLLSNELTPYFYLHPKGTPFGEPMAAYLRITFPLRAKPHYDLCLNAKRVQLRPEFQAKLGWLTTRVFGRVGTPDFDSHERTKIAKTYVDAIEGITWMRRGALEQEARNQGHGDSLKKLTKAQVEGLLPALLEKSYPELVADRVIDVARSVLSDTSADELDKLRRHLLTDKEFNAATGD